ncbi:MAG: hypothetical protein LBC93_03795, partial [Synergistaceae bacterium]|nr:hypothetical protein [Synergistaceae bacterium]
FVFCFWALGFVLLDFGFVFLYLVLGLRASGFGLRAVFPYLKIFLNSCPNDFFQLKKFLYTAVSGHVFSCAGTAVFICRPTFAVIFHT